MRCQKETEQTKEQVPQRGFKETQVLAVVNNGQNERRKNLLPQNKNKEALVSDNEESDDEE